jgi:hypothetical protein
MEENLCLILKKEKMKKVSAKLKAGLVNDSPGRFSTAAFRKKNKKRILPDVFYPRWELELLSSIAAIVILWILPDWINDTNNLLSSKYDVDINSAWTGIVGKIVMAGFIISFILRIIWLRLVWKWHHERSSRGDQIFKNQPANEMRLQAWRTRKLASILDEVAEVVFFVSSVILFVMLLSYLIQILSSLLNHSMFKSQDMPGIK